MFRLNKTSIAILILTFLCVIGGNFLCAQAWADPSCGGYSDTCECGAHNQYPCSTNGCGNCGWWAWHKACCEWGVGLPIWGNAVNWLDKAKDNGYSTGSIPKVNSIFVRHWKGTVEGVYKDWGHVGWVTAVHADGSFDTSEQGWGGWNGGTWCGPKNFEGNTVDSLKSIPTNENTKLIGFIYKEKMEELFNQIETKQKNYSNKELIPPPSIPTILYMLTPDLVELVNNVYFSAQDYQYLSVKSLTYAKNFLEMGSVSYANKYIEKADRYYKLSIAIWRDSQAVLDSTITTAKWKTVYEASRTALGFATLGIGGITGIQKLGVACSRVFDIGTLYTDYLLDISTISHEQAKKNLIAKAIYKILFDYTGTTKFIGNAVKHGWGSSRAFPVLKKIMGSSEFKDEVLREFMRLGGDIGDYVAKKTIEETLTKIAKGIINEKPAPPKQPGIPPSAPNKLRVTE
jgi:surface antigen